MTRDEKELLDFGTDRKLHPVLHPVLVFLVGRSQSTLDAEALFSAELDGLTSGLELVFQSVLCCAVLLS